MTEYEEEIPSWTCKKWGQYEHDWIDCDECLKRYEEWLGQDESPLKE